MESFSGAEGALESDGSWINDEGAYCLSAHVTAFNRKWACERTWSARAHTHTHTDCSTPIFTSSPMEITQSSIPNQASTFCGRHTDSRFSLMLNYFSGNPRSKPPGKFKFRASVYIYIYVFFLLPFLGGLLFFCPSSPFFSLHFRRLRWWILCSSSSNAEGETPEIRATEARGGWRVGGRAEREGGNYQGGREAM